MPRKKIELSNRFPYHVTNRSNNRDWFFIPIQQAWSLFCEILTKASLKYETQIHCFVLMSNHYHLLVSTPLANLSAFMRYFQTETCRAIQRPARRINHVFGNRYKWSLLEDPVAVAYAYKYVLRNPVRAEMVERVQDYPFSSWNSLVNHKNDVPYLERIDSLWRLIPKPQYERLQWLNKPTTKEAEALIAKALRRAHFSFSRGNEVRLFREILQQTYGVEIAPNTFSAEK